MKIRFGALIFYRCTIPVGANMAAAGVKKSIWLDAWCDPVANLQVHTHAHTHALTYTHSQAQAHTSPRRFFTLRLDTHVQAQEYSCH